MRPDQKPWHMLNLKYFHSFVHLEDFIPLGFCWKKTTASYLLTVYF